MAPRLLVVLPHFFILGLGYDSFPFHHSACSFPKFNASIHGTAGEAFAATVRPGHFIRIDRFGVAEPEMRG